MNLRFASHARANALASPPAAAGALTLVPALLLLLLPASLSAQEDVQTSLRRHDEAPTIGAGVQPPDGVWQTDEDGKEFFFDKYPKIEGAYRWVDEEKGVVRLRHLMPLEVHSHDDEFFYFKIYRREKVEIEEPENKLPLLPLEVQLEEQDELELRAVDEGLPRSGQWRNGFVFADMNEDGIQDIVHGPARKSFAPPSIFLGSEDGTWAPWESVQFDDAPFDYGDVAVDDFNQDGHLDIALAIHLTGVVVMVGDGEGRFRQWGEGLPVVRTKTQSSGKEKRIASPFTSRAIVATDWTGDGRPDLLALAEGPSSPEAIAEGNSGPKGRVLLENKGDGSWELRSDGTGFIGDTLIVTDFNDDGQLDFVTDSLRMGDGQLINLGGDAAAEGLWTTEYLELNRPTPILRGAAVADFDGDGRKDLAMSIRAIQERQLFQAVDLYLQRDGDSRWEHRVVLSSISETENFRSLTAGDLDGDGDSDLVVLLSEGHTWLLMNDGKGGFRREVEPGLIAEGAHEFCSGYRARITDLDGDGRMELAANFAGEPGSEKVFLGVAKPRCTSRGSLRLWTVAPKSAATGG
ncbi:MAG: VCBS repeat-containing protein [Acidobacteriota bacterium]